MSIQADSQFCGDTGVHEPHPWSDEESGPVLSCPGIAVVGIQPGVLKEKLRAAEERIQSETILAEKQTPDGMVRVAVDMQMPKWEYMWVDVADASLSRLNSLGASGWQCPCSVVIDGMTYLLLQREILDNATRPH